MKIMIVSNSINLSSGFGIVAKNICLGLKKLGHDVSASGQQQAHYPTFYFGIESLPILGTSANETTQLILNIQKTNPDILLHIYQSDSGSFSGHLFAGFEAERILRKKIKSYFYTPIESLGLSAIAKRDLRIFTEMGGIVVAQCRWGQNEMLKEGIKSEVIYHGVDGGIFIPIDLSNDKLTNNKYCYYSTDVGQIMSDPRILCERGCYKCSNGNILETKDCPNFKEEEINLLIWVDINNSDVSNSENKTWALKKIKINSLPRKDKGKFIFLMVANNLGVRKRIELALKAYSILISENRQIRDRSMLYIRSEPLNIDGINLFDVIRRLGIEYNIELENNIVFIGGDYNNVSDEAMNMLHNISSCYLSTSSGEGFSIPIIESEAVGHPIIGPKNTSFVELVEEDVIGNDEKNKKKIGPRGILVSGIYQMIIDGSSRFLVDENDLVIKMKLMYNMKDVDRKIYRSNCLEFAKLVTWDKICDKWNQLFAE